MRTSTRFIVAAASGLVCFAPAALAQTPPAGPTVLPSVRVGDPDPSIKVSYVDLDTASQDDMRTLTSRIRSAVRRVCWQSHNPRDLEEVYLCRNESRRDAWRQFERNQEQAQAGQGLMVAAVATRRETH